MKLKAYQKNDVAVLEVSGPMIPQELPVLKAGIGKYFRSGKNKILLDLRKTEELPVFCLKELVKLHLLASELSGAIVIAGKSEAVKKVIQSYSTPPPLRYFEEIDQAIQSFSLADAESVLKDAEPPKPAAAPVPGTLPAAQDTVRLRELEKENAILRGRVQNADTDASKKLRAENSELKTAVNAMEAEIRELVRFRKTPVDPGAYKSRILQLEASLAEYAEGAKEAPKDAKAPAEAAKPGKPGQGDPAPAKS